MRNPLSRDQVAQIAELSVNQIRAVHELPDRVLVDTWDGQRLQFALPHSGDVEPVTSPARVSATPAHDDASHDPDPSTEGQPEEGQEAPVVEIQAGDQATVAVADSSGSQGEVDQPAPEAGSQEGGSQEESPQMEAQAADEAAQPEVPPAVMQLLAQHGFDSEERIQAATDQELEAIRGIGKATVSLLRAVYGPSPSMEEETESNGE